MNKVNLTSKSSNQESFNTICLKKHLINNSPCAIHSKQVKNSDSLFAYFTFTSQLIQAIRKY